LTTRPIEILFVDDDPIDVRLTTEQLAKSKLHNRVAWAKDGIEALAYLRQEGEYAGVSRPDLILLDLNMPRMDGYQFLTEVKSDQELSSIPIVVLTTSDEEADILQSYRLHANAFVTKPVGLTEMGKVVGAIEGFWLEVVRLPLDRRPER